MSVTVVSPARRPFEKNTTGQMPQGGAVKLPGGNVLAYIMLPLRFALFALLFSITCAPPGSQPHWQALPAAAGAAWTP